MKRVLTGTIDMFADLKPPRATPRRLMHVCDAGDGCCENETPISVRYACARCGHETEWVNATTVTEAKRGIPCPHCNAAPRRTHSASHTGDSTALIVVLRSVP